MSKQLKEFLALGECGEPRPKQKDFYLDSLFEQDPTRYCPECSSREIRSLHTHNLDGKDYSCTKCNFRYTLWLFNEGEDNIGPV